MGFVYLIYDQNNDNYKIGVTKRDPKIRLKKLQTGNPCKLKLICFYKCEYPYRLEKMLHTHYKLSKELNEWFFIEDPDEFLSKCEFFDKTIDVLKDNPFFSKNLK